METLTKQQEDLILSDEERFKYADPDWEDWMGREE